MSRSRSPLPIDDVLPECVERLRTHSNLIVIAPPGTGKTTRLPPYLLANLLSADEKLILLQPRRIAARRVAERMAEEQGWVLGQEVGYQVRFERKISRSTRLQVLTEGLLTRRIQDDPFLEGFKAVILDEFHERSLHADFALTLLRQIQNDCRPDLLIIILSATLNPEPVSEFLNEAPVIHTQAPLFPLEIEYETHHPKGTIGESVAEKIISTWEPTPNHILAFLPGFKEIRQAQSHLENFSARQQIEVLPLHGSLSWEEQNRVFEPSQKSKIILSTNIAETSVTIDGVDTVVDSGWARTLRQDLANGLNRLELERISKFSAEQRGGRAARQGAGRNYRLWTQREHRDLQEAQSPEILRVDLSSLVLELKAWGIQNLHEISWLTSPQPSSLKQAETFLELIGGLDAQGGMTELGRELMKISTHPRWARIIVEGRYLGAPQLACFLVALLEEGNLRSLLSTSGPQLERSDLLLAYDVFKTSRARKKVERMAKQYLRQLDSQRSSTSRDKDLTEDEELRMLLPAFPDRIVRRREGDPGQGRMVGGKGVQLSSSSHVREGEFYLALDLQYSTGHQASDPLVHLASAIERIWIEESFPHLVTDNEEIELDDKTGKVLRRVTRTFLDLPLEAPRLKPVSPDDVQAVLSQWINSNPETILSQHEEVQDWLIRYHWLKDKIPGWDWPLFDTHELGSVLASLTPGKKTLTDFSAQEIVLTLEGMLSRELKLILDREAPLSLTLPKGRKAKIRYKEHAEPIVEARIQELFGLHESPLLAQGQLRLRFEILGPNYRPVQRTDDLKSFWENTYQQVRKDLRGRYPKHHWPEDPK